MSAVEIRNLSPRESRYVALKVMNPDMCDADALRQAGFGESVVGHPSRVVSDEMREYVERIRAQAIEATLQEAFLDAAEVLRELIRNYAGLLVQEARLQSMLGHDIAELYDERGNVKAIALWPEKWRTMLVVEIESRESSERSHDGTTEDKEGGWDKTGELKKVKRESTLAIEKELRDCKRAQVDCLKVIGNHQKVRAFPVPGDKLGDGMNRIADAINAATVVSLASVCTPEQLQELRQRALESQNK